SVRRGSARSARAAGTALGRAAHKGSPAPDPLGDDVRPLSARPLDRRHGGRLRLRRGLSAQSPPPQDDDARPGREPDPALRRAASYEFLWRPASLVAAARRAVHRAVVPELPEVSPLAALPADDARPGTSGAVGFRARPRPPGPTLADVRPGPAFLLPSSMVRRAPAGRRRQRRPGPTRVLAARGRALERSPRLRVLAGRRLPDVDRRARPALSPLPLVRRAQAAPARRLAELLLIGAENSQAINPAQVIPCPSTDRARRPATRSRACATSRRTSGNRPSPPGSAGCSTAWTCTFTSWSRPPSSRSRLASPTHGMKTSAGTAPGSRPRSWSAGRSGAVSSGASATASAGAGR